MPAAADGYGAERGVVILEMAIIAPLLIIFFISVVDIGQAIHIHHVMSGITREAVRQLSMQPGLEVEEAENLSSGCSDCAQNHALVHQRIARLVEEAAQTGLPIYSDDELAPDELNYRKRRIITSRSAGDVSANLRVTYRAIFKVFDKMPISTERTGPYLSQ